MKIVFWGTPQYAAENLLSLIRSGHDVVAVVTQPDRKRGRGKKLNPSPVKQIALDFEIPVYTTPSIRNDQVTIQLLIDLKADIFVVVAFGQILPKQILKLPKLGCWNSHASLLPKWRGAAPIQWSLLENDLITGVCIMAMEEGLDTGPVINQATVDIQENDNLDTLTSKLCGISSQLLISSLKEIKLTIELNEEERLKYLKAIDQSSLKGSPSYARQLTKEDYLIDWNKNSINIMNKINGLYPNAYTFFKGRRIKIFEVNNLSKSTEAIDNIDKENKKPGKVISIIKNVGFIVMTNDRPLLIKSAQLEGKSKVNASTLLIQADLSINCLLG